MSPARLIPGMKGARLRAVKVALLLAVAAGFSSTAFGEHFTSRCRALHLLVPPLPRSSVSYFALQVSLRSFASTKSSPTLSYAKTSYDPDQFSIDGLPSGSEELGTSFGSAERVATFKLKPSADTSTLPHLLAWLDGWRMDMERGLFRPLRSQASRLAIAYTDIFDTRGHPDKGGHGLGILLRYDFRKASELR